MRGTAFSLPSLMMTRMPLRLERLERRAARDERHVLARVRKLRPDESADRAGPDDRYSSSACILAARIGTLSE